MCFSPEADLVGGVVIAVIGGDILRHTSDKKHKALASIPLLFAGHQLTEAFVWWGLQGHVHDVIENVAKWLYLLFAFVLLPMFIPFAVRQIEPPGPRRKTMSIFTAIGAAVAVTLLAMMVIGGITARLADHHIAYGVSGVPREIGFPIIVVYVAVTCGSLLLARNRAMALYGAINVVMVAILARLTIADFASIWCAWAAVSSGIVALYLRLKSPLLTQLPRRRGPPLR